MALNIRKEFIVKHAYWFMFLTLASLVLVICSWTYKKHVEEHNRTCLFEEVELQCTTLSNLLQQEIRQTYAEVKTRNDLFVTGYLNIHVPVKEFFLDRLTERKPAAKLVGSKSCVRNDDQMMKVLFGANNEGPHHSLGFLKTVSSSKTVA